MQCPLVKSLFSYCNGFLLRKRHYYACIVIQVLKNTFFNGYSTKNSKILNDHMFNSCISMSLTTKQINKKFHPQP